MTVFKSHIHHNRGYGIFLNTGNTDVLIDSVHAEFNDRNGLKAYAALNSTHTASYAGGVFPIDYTKTSLENERVTVRNSEWNNNRVCGIGCQRTWRFLVENNHVHDNGSTGIQFENACRYLVARGNLSERNNTIYGSETGIWFD
jgi:hypothetical protein